MWKLENLILTIRFTYSLIQEKEISEIFIHIFFVLLVQLICIFNVYIFKLI